MNPGKLLNKIKPLLHKIGRRLSFDYNMVRFIVSGDVDYLYEAVRTYYYQQRE